MIAASSDEGFRPGSSAAPEAWRDTECQDVSLTIAVAVATSLTWYIGSSRVDGLRELSIDASFRMTNELGTSEHRPRSFFIFTNPLFSPCSPPNPCAAQPNHQHVKPQPGLSNVPLAQDPQSALPRPLTWCHRRDRLCVARRAWPDSGPGVGV